MSPKRASAVLLYRQIKVFCDGFGCFFHAVVDPPAQGVDEGGADMIDPEILGEFAALSCFKLRQLRKDNALQLVFEVGQKQVVVLTRQQIQNMIVVLQQMAEQMQEYAVRCITFKHMVMVGMPVFGCVKNMAEQVFAELLQQKILCLKMGIEGRSAHIGFFNDLADGDVVKIFFG